MLTREPLDSGPSPNAAFGILSLLAVAAALDVIAPASFETGAVYLPAIGLAAWSCGRGFGIGLSLLAVLLRLSGTPHPQSAAALWGAGSWLGAYLLVTFLAAHLRRASQRQHLLERTDALTGLANRTALLERIDAELNRARRSQTPLTVAYIDCDRFKQINDRLGHAAGDRVLQDVAAALERGIRSYDLAARPGGDEFVVVLSDTGHDAARSAVGRIESLLQEEMRSHGWNLTFSIGAVTLTEASPSAAEALRAADELMYAVKQGGRNGTRFGTAGSAAAARAK